jgi:hypothetical protein
MKNRIRNGLYLLVLAYIFGGMVSFLFAVAHH